jgi:hypothetical protein
VTDRQNMLADWVVGKAVSRIVQRAERQQDASALERTYVDAGALSQLANDNNQILYGRRGTGKSHVLRILGILASREPAQAFVYLDLRSLGSAQLMTDRSRSLTTRSVGVFRDLIYGIQSELLDWATDPSRPNPGLGLEEVSLLGEAVKGLTNAVSEREITAERQASSTNRAGVDLRAGLSGLSLGVNASDERASTDKMTEHYHQIYEDTIVFSAVSFHLDKALRALGISRLLLLLDEWIALPLDVQPYVAEFLRRTILHSHLYTIKIASLEYASQFSISSHESPRIGFELGGDIIANVDLDDYYVYERAPDRATTIFGELLFRHIQADLTDQYLSHTYGLKAPDEFLEYIFDDPSTFEELVRAGEGVVRDFLCIFTSAYFRAVQQSLSRIDRRSVEQAALDWFEIEKAPNLSRRQEYVLQKIVEQVIGVKRSRCFLLERRLALNPLIQSLFDLRLIHLLRRGYTDREHPGVRYNVYALDYGTYVNLRRMDAKQIEVDIKESLPLTPDRISPFDDDRTIPRVIIDSSFLDE